MSNKKDIDIVVNEIKRNNKKRDVRKWIVIIVAIVIVYFVGGSFLPNKITLPGIGGFKKLFGKPAGEVETTASHDLVSKIQKSQLNLVEYPYSGCFVEKNSKDKEIYYVYFTGKVKAGINVEEIKDENIHVDEEKKEITIDLPKIVVEEPNVDQGKMEYIFLDGKYDNDEEHVKSYDKAVEIMREKANEEGQIKENARDAAKSFVQDLVKAIVNVEKDSYEVIVK